jgi:hypothetical protein
LGIAITVVGIKRAPPPHGEQQKGQRAKNAEWNDQGQDAVVVIAADQRVLICREQAPLHGHLGQIKIGAAKAVTLAEEQILGHVGQHCLPHLQAPIQGAIRVLPGYRINVKGEETQAALHCKWQTIGKGDEKHSYHHAPQQKDGEQSGAK